VDLLEFVKVLWPIASTITPLILAAGFLWLRTKFPSREEVEKLSAKVEQLDGKLDDHEVRVGKIEFDQKSEPTRADLNRVQTALGERIGGVEATLRGMGQQLGRIDTYLHTLIDKGLEHRGER
jgi:hypothetical protein